MNKEHNFGKCNPLCDDCKDKLLNEVKKENSINVKITSIICGSILSFTAIIGIFWGITGIKNTYIGLGILIAILLLLFILTLSD